MYSVTFQQIVTFLMIAKYTNLSKAADAMYISQPALSKTLQRFEDGIGMRLFFRGNQGVVLTQEGEYLYTMLEPLYNNFNRIIDTARAIGNMPLRSLRFVLPPVYDVSEAYSEAKLTICRFSEAYPDIVLSEQLCEFPELREALEFGSAEIAIAQDFVVADMRNVRYKRISEFEMYLAMSSCHPLAACELDDIPLAALSEEMFYRVGFQDEMVARCQYLKECEQIGFSPKRFEFVSNVQTLVHNIRENKGMALCGRFRYFGEEGDIRYFSLPPIGERKYIIAAWHTRHMSPETQLFINMLPGDEMGF